MTGLGQNFVHTGLVHECDKSKPPALAQVPRERERKEGRKEGGEGRERKRKLVRTVPKGRLS